MMKENLESAENIHPTSGMKTGIPDTLFFYDKNFLMVEMKTGVVNYFEKNTGTIVSKSLTLKHPILASQKRWHRNMKDIGAPVGLIVGVRCSLETKPWRIFLVKHSRVIANTSSSVIDFSDLKEVSLETALGLISKKRGN
jgi:hypothetical protein